MNRRRLLLSTLAALAAAPIALAATAAPAAAQLKVVTSTTDLYDIARAVGGNKISATHISEGYQDPHFVEPKPSFVLSLQKADVWAFVGLDLEVGWMPPLIQSARNQKIVQGGSGYLDASKVIRVLDVPSGNVDRSGGDVHALGNPHYWLDPENARRLAKMFKDKFSQLDPKNEDFYEANEKAFNDRLSAAERTWAPLIAQIRGKPIVAYHTSWRYLAQYTGVNIVAFMEPKPGVPPSATHLAGVIQTMRRTGAKVIMQEPFYNRRDADKVASITGAKVLILPPSVGGIRQGVDSYIALMDYDIRQLAAAVQ